MKITYDYLVEKAVNCLVKENTASPEDVEIYRFGVEVTFLKIMQGLSSKMCKLIFRRSYDRHIYYLKLNQRVAPHHFYKPHIKVTYHALSGTGNR